MTDQDDLSRLRARVARLETALRKCYRAMDCATYLVPQKTEEAELLARALKFVRKVLEEEA